jgi:3-hydroxyisobutyrate dehydrogenase-like beta-hydroxyacid dehydrogenase
VKDVDLALMAAAGVGVELPATQRVRELYERSMEAGFEWKDYSAVVLELEKRAGLQPAEMAR